jgi:DMSO/TMAO reductase YedYZ heme-binding membrane subunit
LGILSFYLILLTSVSFSFRKQLGQRRWRQLHYLTFVAYGLVTLHGLMAGTDSADPGMRLVYLGSSTLVIFLTLFRVLAGADQPEGRRARP